MKPFLIITGMHRSGTSFLARSLNLSGVYFGEPDSLISNDWKYLKDNLRGHWENKEILELTSKTLEINNGSWDNIPDKILVDEKTGKQISDKIKKISNASILGAGFKDPRILLVLDSWLPYISDQFLIVGIFRDPLKVAESLKNRNGFSYEKSLDLWKEYNQKLLTHLKKHNGFLLNFDWPKDRLLSEIKLIARKLGLSEDINLSEWYTEELFHSDKTYQTNYQLANDIKSIYTDLQTKSGKNSEVGIKVITHDSKELSKTINHLLTQNQAQGNYFKGISIEYESALKQRDESLKQRDKSLKQRDKSLKQRDKTLKQRDKTLKQRDKTLNSLQKEFDERTKWALDLDTKNKEKDKSISDLQVTVTTKDSQMQDLQSKVIRTKSELDGIKNSYSFKVLTKILNRIDRVFPKSTKRGKLLQLFIASLTIIQNEGMRVFFQAFKDKIRYQVYQKKINSALSKQSIPKVNLSFTNYLQSDTTSNIFYNKTRQRVDLQLREDIMVGASNILNLPRFPKISIIIPTFDQVNFLKQCLTSIESKSTYKNYEIIIVTNNLDENSEMRRFLKTSKNRVLIFDKEYSFGAINNFASKESKGEFLLFLNDDVEIISPNWLEALLKLGLDERVGVVGAKLLFPNGKLQEAGGIVWGSGAVWNYGRNSNPDDLDFNFVRDVDYSSASCLLVKKKIFEKVKGFDLRYTVAYCEDNDLCHSIKDLGYRILYQPLACVIHHEGKTSGTDVRSGIKSYQIQNEKKFKKKWNRVLKNRGIDSEKNAFIERNRKQGANILFIDHYVPEYDKDSGSLVTFYIMNIFSSLGNRVTFWPENLNKKEPYVSELQQKGIEVIYGPNNFESFIKERGWEFHICFTGRPHISKKFIEIIKKYAPHCKILYDTHDLHFVREMREAKLANDPIKFEKAKLTRKNEFEIIHKADITITRGIKEANIVLDDNSSLKLAVIPPLQIPQKDIPSYNLRKDILFVGGFQHAPNVDAIEYLIKDIFPKILKLQNVKLYIIGSNPTQKVVDLCTNKKNVIFLGYVENIEPYLKKCRILIAPLRFGAGVKGKITQSMAYGLPVVTSSIGTESISDDNSKVLIEAENSNDFAKKTVALYNDEKSWTELSNNGKEFAEKHYSPESVRSTICQILEYCLENKTN